MCPTWFFMYLKKILKLLGEYSIRIVPDFEFISVTQIWWWRAMVQQNDIQFDVLPIKLSDVCHSNFYACFYMETTRNDGWNNNNGKYTHSFL